MVDVGSVVGEHYALQVAELAVVAGGADRNACLWQAVDERDGRFAIKWSSGGSPAGLVLPAALNATRPGSAPEPLPTRTGALWVDIDGARLSVMEWVHGTSAMQAPLGRQGWRSVGRLLAALHVLPVRGQVRTGVPREDFDPSRWAGLFTQVDAEVDTQPTEELTQDLARLWCANRAQLRRVHHRTLALADKLNRRKDLPEFSACHADPHLGNILVQDGSTVLLDFDDAVLAPRERDLMFVLGGGVLADMAATREQQRWFLQGYGQHEVDTDLLTYYRGLRVLEDASELAEVVLDPRNADRDRSAALGHVRGVFSPTGLLAQTTRTFGWSDGTARP